MKLNEIGKEFTRDNMLVLSQEECEDLFNNLNEIRKELLMQVFVNVDGHIVKSTIRDWDFYSREGVVVFADTQESKDFTFNLNRVKEFFVYRFYNEITLELALTETGDFIDITFFVEKKGY